VQTHKRPESDFEIVAADCSTKTPNREDRGRSKIACTFPAGPTLPSASIMTRERMAVAGVPLGPPPLSDSRACPPRCRRRRCDGQPVPHRLGPASLAGVRRPASWSSQFYRQVHRWVLGQAGAESLGGRLVGSVLRLDRRLEGPEGSPQIRCELPAYERLRYVLCAAGDPISHPEPLVPGLSGHCRTSTYAHYAGDLLAGKRGQTIAVDAGAGVGLVPDVAGRDARGLPGHRQGPCGEPPRGVVRAWLVAARPQTHPCLTQTCPAHAGQTS
jgi:hypothetical protein